MGHAELTLHDTLAARTSSMDEYWMPFTPNRDFKHDPKMVVRAEGMHLWNERGGKLIDAASGLFCVNAGHGRASSTSSRRSRAAIRSSSSLRPASPSLHRAI